MSERIVCLIVLASLSMTGAALGQGATGGGAVVQPIPHVTVKGISAVTSLANWPGLQLSVDKDAYVTVFAVTRTKGSALPIQILSPVQPGDGGKIKAGKSVHPRRLLGEEAMHLLNYGESPLIVAFASSVKPELSAFKAGAAWGHDLLMDTLVASEQQMVEVLAKTIFASGVAFDAVVSEPSAITPVPAIAGAFAFNDGPTRFARFATTINGQLEATLDPIIRTSDVYMRSGTLPAGYVNGAPFTLKGGSLVAIERGRLVYLPQTNGPPTAAQRAGQAKVGTPVGTPATPPPDRKLPDKL